MNVKNAILRKWMIRITKFWRNIRPELVQLATKPQILYIYVLLLIAPVELTKEYVLKNQTHFWLTGTIIIGLWGFSALLATLASMNQAVLNQTYAKNAADQFMASGFRYLQSSIVLSYSIYIWHDWQEWYLRCILILLLPNILGALIVFTDAAKHLFNGVHWVEMYIKSRD